MVAGAAAAAVAVADPDPALDAARARLNDRQAALLGALVAAGPPVPGADEAQVAATRHALMDKRRAGVARAWPALAATPGFATRFAAFAAARPPGGSWADGFAFARAIRSELADDARRELLRARCAGRTIAVRVDRPGTGPPDDADAPAPGDAGRDAGAAAGSPTSAPPRPPRHTMIAIRLPGLAARIITVPLR